jgi:hypothetical protein
VHRWRSTNPRNGWKDEPWGIEKLPTVVKITAEVCGISFLILFLQSSSVGMASEDSYAPGADFTTGLGEIS